MKKIGLTVLLILALFSTIAPGRPKEMPTVGERINVWFSGEQTFQSGMPFHVYHGWIVFDADLRYFERARFGLYINGVLVEDSIRYTRPAETRGETLIVWIYNFPLGLPMGTYTFNGVWRVPCDYVYGRIECRRQGLPDLVIERQSLVTITFTP